MSRQPVSPLAKLSEELLRALARLEHSSDYNSVEAATTVGSLAERTSLSSQLALDDMDACWSSTEVDAAPCAESDSGDDAAPPTLDAWHDSPGAFRSSSTEGIADIPLRFVQGRVACPILGMFSGGYGERDSGIQTPYAVGQMLLGTLQPCQSDLANTGRLRATLCNTRECLDHIQAPADPFFDLFCILFCVRHIAQAQNSPRASWLSWGL